MSKRNRRYTIHSECADTKPEGMAKSRYEYVRLFEHDPPLLPNTYLCVRIDGRGFHRFSDEHDFEKPNDVRALRLMNEAAESCLRKFQDIVLAYGQSDEYSFIMRKETALWDRRTSKIVTAIVSHFTAVYVMKWNSFMQTPEGTPIDLKYPPEFDGRIVCYPSLQNIRDYLSWRQADCHINNLYNTSFWSLVLKSGLSKKEAAQKLDGTVSKEKNELLWSEFGINYAKENEMFRKGSTFLRQVVKSEPEQSCSAVTKDENQETSTTTGDEPFRDVSEKKRKKKKVKQEIVLCHLDMIGDEFWKNEQYPLYSSTETTKRR